MDDTYKLKLTEIVRRKLQTIKNQLKPLLSIRYLVEKWEVCKISLIFDSNYRGRISLYSALYKRRNSLVSNICININYLLCLKTDLFNPDRLLRTALIKLIENTCN